MTNLSTTDAHFLFLKEATWGTNWEKDVELSGIGLQSKSSNFLVIILHRQL